MGDADVIAKLSKILDQHDLSGQDGEIDLQNSDLGKFIDKATSSASPKKRPVNGGDISQLTSAMTPHQTSSPGRRVGSPVRTPFDMWQERQKLKMKSTTPKKKTQITEHEKIELVEQLYKKNLDCQNAIIKDQNAGLKMELQGHEFKPKLNTRSIELSKTMKPMLERNPGIFKKWKEQEKFVQSSKKFSDNEEAKLKECTFKPERESAKVSDKYLKKLGRSEKVKPEDFFQYKKFKDQRNDQRREILNEIESKQLTFHPKLNPTSADMARSRALTASTSTLRTSAAVKLKNDIKGEDYLQTLRKVLSFHLLDLYNHLCIRIP